MQRELVAIHEAGHAVVAVELGMGLQSVTIEQRACANGTAAGQTYFDDRGAPLEHVAIAWLAGRAAQLHAGADDTGCLHDLAYVRDLGLRTGFYQLEAEAQRLVAAHWAAINAVAIELLRRGSLTGREYRRLLPKTL